MTPDQFIRKWRGTTLKERSAAQEHFIDLCNLLDEPTPGTDSGGREYCFEKGAVKTTGADGWADVWKKGHFGWEYKGRGKNLQAALAQLQQYSPALDNPPLLIVSDLETIRIHTNWTNTVAAVFEIGLEDLRDAAHRQKLKWAMSDPDKLRPSTTRQQLTEVAASEFARLAIKLGKLHPADTVAHFLNRLVFCMFAEDVGLLPDNMFSEMLRASKRKPEDFRRNASSLFQAMSSPGGRIGYTDIDWFNGGLFDDDTALPLDEDDIEICLSAASLYWNDIDPSILGTLFERGLDPDKRSQLGAHYTDRDKIMMIIEPVLIRPLMAEWQRAKVEIARLMELPGRSSSARTKNRLAAEKVYAIFLERIRQFRVLDPACGSGNFLYLALRALKDIEHKAGLDVEVYGLSRQFPQVGPANVLGLELSAYAAELARVTVWIGEIQWMLQNGFDVNRNPILQTLKTIQNVDALLNDDGTARVWPTANVIIGNPPFLGAKLMNRRLGHDYTKAIRAVSTLPAFTDLVCHWFEHAHRMIKEGVVERAGLVATNSIKQNTNLPVLRRIVSDLTIFDAWSNEKWTVEGAKVQVSLVCFALANDQEIHLNGAPAPAVFPDLTSDLDLTQALPLAENRGWALIGIQKSGPFDISGETARDWMAQPSNPNGVSNSKILKPYWNGDDVTGRPRDMWLIDLPQELTEADAALFDVPYRHLKSTPDENGKLLPDLRAGVSDDDAHRWWEQWRPRPELRERIKDLPRYLVTPETADYRIFTWLQPPALPDKNLIVIPRSDDLAFGILQSGFHSAWAVRKGSDLRISPRYTLTTTFATFPFPDGYRPGDALPDLTSDPIAKKISDRARDLFSYRENWLNPPELVVQVTENFDLGTRFVPRDDEAARQLSTRTLTELYKTQPEWLKHAHKALDQAVAEAYGWPADIGLDDALLRLLDLNIARRSESATQKAA